jgi:hypothetical protein
MALTKNISVDQITVIENGVVLVRQVTRILENGTEISKQYHRSTFAPGSDISAQTENVKNICNVAWTPDVVATYVAQQEANLPTN